MGENWKMYKLGDVANVQNGYAFKSKDLGESGIPVIKIKNIVPPNVVLEGAGYYTKEIEPKLEKYILKRNNFLISMTGSTVNVMSSAVGKMGKYRLDEIALLNQRAGKIYITDSENADFDFVCHFLNRYEVHYNLALNATGSANQANISPAQIKDIDLFLPPLEEQKAIASILSALDDKIEINLQMNKTLESMAMALYKHWFVDFGPFRDGEFVDSELGNIPKGWKVMRLGEVCEKIYSGGTPKTKIPEYWNGEIPWLSSGETRENYIIKTDKFITELGLKKSSSKMAYKFDIVIASAGQGKTRGQTSLLLIDTSVNQSVLCLRANRNLIHPLTLFCDLSSRYDEFRHISDSFSTRGSLTTKLIGGQIKLVLPSIEIQEEFHKKLEDFNSLQENLLFENQTLTKLRDTLLPKLISGEVRVKDIASTITEVL
jgi:type I restriction enzyme S subunit